MRQRLYDYGRAGLFPFAISTRLQCDDGFRYAGTAPTILEAADAGGWNGDGRYNAAWDRLIEWSCRSTFSFFCAVLLGCSCVLPPTWFPAMQLQLQG